MKGQYRILSEILIFAVGVAITSYVVLSFHNIEISLISGKNNAGISVIKDHLSSVADLVANNIIKASESGADSSIKLHIPKKVSNHLYKISLVGNSVITSSFENPDIKHTQQLFNIGEKYSITGDVLSSAEYIEIERIGDTIKLKRWDVYG